MTKLWLTILILVAIAVPVLAHHSFAVEYDRNKFITLKGVVTELDWRNPHIYFFLDVKGADGKVVNWKIEGYPPNMAVRRGFKRDSMKVGDAVTVTGWQAHNGASRAHSREVTWADGRKAETGPPAGTGGPPVQN